MLKYWSFIFDYHRIWVRSSPEQMHFLPQSIKLVCFQRLITVLTAVLLPSTFIFGWQKLQMFAKIFANSDKVRSETGGNYVQIWICKHLIWSGVWWKVVDSLHLSHSWFISQSQMRPRWWWLAIIPPTTSLIPFPDAILMILHHSSNFYFVILLSVLMASWLQIKKKEIKNFFFKLKIHPTFFTCLFV